MDGQASPAPASPDSAGSAVPLAPGSARWAHLWNEMATQSVDLIIVIAQPSYSVEYINPAGRAMLGLPTNESLDDRSMMEFVSNHCLWTLLNDAAPTALRVGSWQGELEVRRLDGEEITTVATLTAHACHNGAADALIMIARDRSEERRTLSMLKRDQRYLRALLENMPDNIYFKDLQSRFMRVSYAMSAKFGATDPEALVGKSDFDFFTPEHAQPAFDAEQQIIRTERPIVNLEEKETWPDGRVTWASTTKVPFYNEYGQVVGTFGVTRDVTARKHTEAALAESQRRLLDASRMAGMAEVASGVLHNVGNAFNSVNTSATLMADQLRNSRLSSLGKVSQLLEQNLPNMAEFFASDARGKQLPNFIIELARQLTRERDELSRELETLRKGVDHIKAVIAMQQNFANASSLAESLTLSDLVTEALTICQSSLNKSGVEITRDFRVVPPVMATRHRVLEILVNLIKNAEHAALATTESKPRVKFTIAASDAKNIQVSVRDNGVGISPENLQKIFSFGFTTKKDGHGFGLHNSALAAKEMSGKLFARSDGLGKGAEFLLVLPVAETVLPVS
jgi:PAS domain S-box-containing protein